MPPKQPQDCEEGTVVDPTFLRQGPQGVAAWNRSRGTASRVVLRDVILDGSDLREANLTGLDLRGASFRGADLRQADFTGSRGLDPDALGGSNLQGATLPEDVDLSRRLLLADEVARGTRASWLVLAGACAYCLLAVGATTDADLVLGIRASDLPLVGVSVPFPRFYAVAPWIVAAILLHFLLHLRRTWEFARALPTRFSDGTRLDEALGPWLVSGLIRMYLSSPRTHNVEWGRLDSWSACLFAWTLAPATIAVLLIRSLVAADPVLFVIGLTALLVAVASCVSSWLGMGGDERPSTSSAIRALATAALLVGIVSYQVWGVSSVAAWEADLRGRVLQGISLARAQLQRAKLTRSDLLGADLRGASLHDADLEGTRLCQSDLRDARLHRAQAKYAKLAQARVDGTYFNGADLEFAVLASVTGQGPRFTGANLKGAWLNAARLSRAVFALADLRGADLRGADLSGGTFHKADLSSADLTDAVLRDGNFAGAKLTGATLDNADLSGAQLQSAEGLDPEQLQKACGVGIALRGGSYDRPCSPRVRNNRKPSCPF